MFVGKSVVYPEGVSQQSPAIVHIGPPLVFERIWQYLGLPQVIQGLLQDRKFEFPVDQAIFMTVLHRLMVDLDDLQVLTIAVDEKTSVVHTATSATGIALGPSIRQQ